MPTPRLVIAVAALTLGLLLTACAGPKLSGFGLGNHRLVRVGEIVELRIPFEADGRRHWRVSSYDSRYLSIVDVPSVERTANGAEFVARARARVQGETVIELVEVDGAGQRLRFDVTIVE